MSRYAILLCLSFVIASLFGCGPTDINSGWEPPHIPSETYGVEIGTFYVENRNMTLRLMDITGLFQEVGYTGRAVPMNHTPYSELPEALKETVKNYGLSSPTQVYRMKWNGDTVYHLICYVYDDIIGVYNPSGERRVFSSMEEYFQFLNEVSDVNCVLLINTEVIRSADGAPNLLVGTWEMDWSHLHHDIGVNGNGIDEHVDLYTNLPFSITEVCHFKNDGTGYLRTVKTMKSGEKEVAYDPFNYWLTDYHTNTDGLRGYTYLCIFAAGDTIEYTARCWDDFNYVFDRTFYYVTYPWYKKQKDSFSGKKGNPKYGIPQKDINSPIIGRWTGIAKNAAQTIGISSYTWVFRDDGTGYLLSGHQFTQSFAYTIDGKNGSEFQLTIYKYDTGFTIQDGFWKEDDWTYSYAPSPMPIGKPLKAKVYNDGNSLELEGWMNRAADYSTTPIVFQRVNR